jgi:hypothetical protein
MKNDCTIFVMLDSQGKEMDRRVVCGKKSEGFENPFH